MAAADRRPVASWAVAATAAGVAVAAAGDVLGGVRAFLWGDGAGVWFVALPVAVGALGLGALAVVAVADLPGRWFGWSRTRSRAAVAVLGVVVAAPWLVPGGPTVLRAGQAPGWAAGCCVAAALALPVAGLLLVPRRRVRAAGAVGLLLLAGSWGVSRHAWLDGEAHATYVALGSPPHAQLRLIDWHGTVPTEADYRDGRVEVEYDVPNLFPVPDGSQVGELVTVRASGSPCAEGRALDAQVAKDYGFDAAPSHDCRTLAHGVLLADGRTLVRQDAGYTVALATGDGTLADDGSLPAALRALASDHPATRAELRTLIPTNDWPAVR